MTPFIRSGSGFASFNRTSMESKLSLGKPSWVPYPPFNRTSMESKRRISGISVHGDRLLIEPVWNRNLLWHHTSRGLYLRLLIEPVWNRNLLPLHFPQRSVLTFNRTSMESKHISDNRVLSPCLPFNRTSMESKRQCGRTESHSRADF